MLTFASFWKPEACGQTVLPDRSVLIGQKLVENAKIQKFKCDILGDFQTLCLSSCSSVKFETKTCIFSLSSISASSFDFFVLSVDDPSALVFDELVSGIDSNSLAKFSLFSSTFGFSSEKDEKLVKVCLHFG